MPGTVPVPSGGLPPNGGHEPSGRNVVTLVYALYAASFVVGLTMVAGVIVAYVKRDDYRGSWLASHLDWQIRTFWWGLLWAVIGLVLTVVLVGFLILLLDAIWLIYRIIKGWLALNDGQPVPV